jgi:hypothetical protein
LDICAQAYNENYRGRDIDRDIDVYMKRVYRYLLILHRVDELVHIIAEAEEISVSREFGADIRKFLTRK